MQTFVTQVGANYRVGMFTNQVPCEENDGEVETLYHFALFASWDDANDLASKVLAAGPSGWNPSYWSEFVHKGDTTPRPANPPRHTSPTRAANFAGRSRNLGKYIGD